MAYIYGRVSLYSRYYSNYNDVLEGTYDADYIDARNGNDVVYAGAGNDEVHGGGGNDIIYAGSSGYLNYVAAWGNDIVFGGTGSDYLFYGNTQSSVTLYGDDFSASTADGDDYMVAGSGDDSLYGGGGNDTMFGGAGADVIHGNDGDDDIMGGIGGDILYGDAGYNTFVYTGAGQSSATNWASADSIMDWYQPQDYINMPIAGTAANYFERTFNSGSLGLVESFALAASIAGNYLRTTDDNYIFLTDGHNGYLFADTDSNYTSDTGIELRGVTSLSQFGYSDII